VHRHLELVLAGLRGEAAVAPLSGRRLVVATCGHELTDHSAVGPQY
jgi:hypothetical protein